MRIDCGTCEAKPAACGDCMVTALLGPNQGVVELDTDEQSALRAMTGAGLLPPLRLVRPVTRREYEPGRPHWFASTEGVV